MSKEVEVRLDTREDENGRVCIWGLSLPDHHPIWSEYMILLYELKNQPGKPDAILYREGMTHEIMVSAIAPETPIVFSTSMFDQKKLSPLTPPNHGYQFKADDNVKAEERIQKLVESCLFGALSIDTDYTSYWDAYFEDGVTLKNNTAGPIS